MNVQNKMRVASTQTALIHLEIILANVKMVSKEIHMMGYVSVTIGENLIENINLWIFLKCNDIDECLNPHACGSGASCTNLEGGYRCDCPEGFAGDARSPTGCVDFDECARSPCGRDAHCINTDGSFRCLCPEGRAGNPMESCNGMYI